MQEGDYDAELPKEESKVCRHESCSLLLFFICLFVFNLFSFVFLIFVTIFTEINFPFPPPQKNNKSNNNNNNNNNNNERDFCSESCPPSSV